ncbi:hypothetical protein XELAEV_18004546mg [Xenopus laevis]|uniref:C2H2-type domain-containing protein n=1 Tax=Xenopus laevis TaxID=8355 RepID=A0A974BR95_XENLA|nr:hypothetical protein XELAEV_18004546mg [Xenopus laevis]
MMDLRNHQKTHPELRPFRCNQCKKEFVDKAGLKKHQWIQSDLFLIVCSNCGKGFLVPSDLGKHQSHSKEVQEEEELIAPSLHPASVELPPLYDPFLSVKRQGIRQRQQMRDYGQLLHPPEFGSSFLPAKCFVSCLITMLRVSSASTLCK